MNKELICNHIRTFYNKEIFDYFYPDCWIKPSTSADGWKYHKPNKKRKSL